MLSLALIFCFAFAVFTKPSQPLFGDCFWLVIISITSPFLTAESSDAITPFTRVPAHLLPSSVCTA
ncbi:Uncharacterised protein [uncultured archaeon]|nr:Uncharacterised protein [uncultured archaeon]